MTDDLNLTAAQSRTIADLTDEYATGSTPTAVVKPFDGPLVEVSVSGREWPHQPFVVGPGYRDVQVFDVERSVFVPIELGARAA